jgi:hypothetical protein
MTNARYLATLSSGTPAKRYAKDRSGRHWTFTKTDAYKFKTEREAQDAAAAGANGLGISNLIPAVQKAPIAPHTRQRRQAASRMDT